ncbi:zinc finger BED domain-containing protein 4-like [Hemicordylus capensis]|uniref:zinc finger BED domain-containing protein 4-like n=1 Tax=Hemicordylus capensis TaxID=884348 RepID=UPI002302C00C|nr:zinc finger BED domain-containing protein 4-like [Hemicordylus capensis]
MLVSHGRDPAHLGTTPMWRHIERHHPGLRGQAGSASAPCASATRAGSGSVPASRQATLPVQRWTQSSGSQRIVRVDHHHLTRLIGEMISTDDQPFQVVENNGFRRILQYLAPEYVIPSRTTFSRNVVPSLYRRCRELVSAELRAAPAGTSVHFTTDLWTSVSGMHASFLALIAHWWGPESEGTSAGDASGSGAAPTALRHRWAVLHVETMDTRHTTEEVAAVLDRQIEEWIGGCPHLSRGFIVTDNGANVTAAVETVMDCVNIRCMAHTLHLTVRDALGLKELKASQEKGARPIPAAVAATATLVDKSRKLAAHFHRSEKSRRLLRQKQDDLGLPRHLIPTDVETRWNSTFLLFQRLLEQERALVALARDESLDVCDFSNAEWKQMSEAVSALEPFQLATKGLCGDTTPLSQALPTAVGLEKLMGGLHISLTTPEGRALAGRLRSGVDKRLVDVLGDREEYVLACLCHPALKGNAVSADELPRWRGILVEKVREKEAARARRDQGVGSGVGAALAAQPAPSSSMGGQPASASPSPPSSQSSSAASQAAPSQQPLATDSRSAQWFQRFCYGAMPGMREARPARPPSSAEQCVAQYLEEPVEGDGVDCAQFWASRRQVWPDLAVVAVRLLSCPPTSVQSERVFSRAGDVVTPSRSRLDPGLVEQLVFLKVNLPLLGYPKLEFEPGE